MAREGRNEDNQVQHRPQVLRRAFWTARQLDLELPVVHVTGIASDGWFSKDLTLGQFGRAREHLARVDPLLVQLEGRLS
jgi:hypothetical protein